MSKRTKTLKILVDYYVQKGKVLTEKEYAAETDTPIRLKMVKRQVTSWARLNKMIERNFPIEFGQIHSDPIDEKKLSAAEDTLAGAKKEPVKKTLEERLADMKAKRGGYKYD